MGAVSLLQTSLYAAKGKKSGKKEKDKDKSSSSESLEFGEQNDKKLAKKSNYITDDYLTHSGDHQLDNKATWDSIVDRLYQVFADSRSNSLTTQSESIQKSQKESIVKLKENLKGIFDKGCDMKNLDSLTNKSQIAYYIMHSKSQYDKLSEKQRQLLVMKHKIAFEEVARITEKDDL